LVGANEEAGGIGVTAVHDVKLVDATGRIVPTTNAMVTLRCR
jgi:hypothetical protein